MNATKEFFKILRGVWPLILLQAIAYALVLWGLWFLVKPYLKGLLTLLEEKGR